MSSWIVSNQKKDDSAQNVVSGAGAAPASSGAGVRASAHSHAEARHRIEDHKRARVLALQALFEIDSTGHAADAVLYERIEIARSGAWRLDDDEDAGEAAPVEQPLGDEGVQFLLWLVAGVLSYRERLDALIHRFAPEWPVDQLAIVDRSILRLALYELGAAKSDTPPKVAINEAVELAKAYGGDSSPRFVNGVLGAALDEARQQGY